MAVACFTLSAASVAAIASIVVILECGVRASIRTSPSARKRHVNVDKNSERS